jgi:type IV pilus assembly protein PilO
MAALAPGGGFNLAKLSVPLRFALGGLFALLIAVTYWTIFYSDISSKIDGATKRSADLSGELAKQKQAQASYFADRDELAMRQQRQRELNKVLPAEAEAATFLSSIQQVSNVSGVDLKAWQPQEEQPQTFFAKVPMRLEMSGRFHQIAKFMFEMGKLDRIINIENIDLTDPKMQGDEVQLKAKCLATTFHLLAAPAAAGAPK